jgi:DNA-binding MarR family transcriptional regulator
VAAKAPEPAPIDPELAPQGVDQSCLAHLLGYQIAQADIPARRVFARHIGEPMGLRPVEFTILVLVAFNPGVTARQLAQALALAAPNMTILLDRLADRHLVERVRSQSDRRAQHLHLTPEGQRLASRAHAASKTMEEEVLRQLSEGERVMLLELLHKVALQRRS